MTKTGDVAGGGRIIGDNQQGMTGLHAAHGFSDHHYRLRAPQSLGIKRMIRIGERIRHQNFPACKLTLWQRICF
jgi:hypothetical protein